MHRALRLLLSAACLLSPLAAVAAESSIANSLEALARRMLSQGLANRVPSPLAEALGLGPNAPVHYAEVSETQATDGMHHSIQVLVEVTTTTPRRPIRPLGFVFSTNQISGRNSDDYKFRVSLDGKLEWAILIDGKADETGKAVKGSGKVIQQDIGSAAIKKRLRHELDLWLKRRYLATEWRSAEFSGGVLEKKKREPAGMK